MGKEHRVGNSPEHQSTAQAVYNSTINKLIKHNTDRTEWRRHQLPREHIVPLVLGATSSAVEMQEGDTSKFSQLLAHKRLRIAYAEGAQAMSNMAGSEEMAASFMNGYIEHTKEVVRLQGSVRKVVFPRSEVEGTGHDPAEGI